MRRGHRGAVRALVDQKEASTRSRRWWTTADCRPVESPARGYSSPHPVRDAAHDLLPNGAARISRRGTPTALRAEIPAAADDRRLPPEQPEITLTLGRAGDDRHRERGAGVRASAPAGGDGGSRRRLGPAGARGCARAKTDPDRAGLLTIRRRPPQAGPPDAGGPAQAGAGGRRRTAARGPGPCAPCRASRSTGRGRRLMRRQAALEGPQRPETRLPTLARPACSGDKASGRGGPGGDAADGRGARLSGCRRWSMSSSGAGADAGRRCDRPLSRHSRDPQHPWARRPLQPLASLRHARGVRNRVELLGSLRASRFGPTVVRGPTRKSCRDSGGRSEDAERAPGRRRILKMGGEGSLDRGYLAQVRHERPRRERMVRGGVRRVR